MFTLLPLPVKCGSCFKQISTISHTEGGQIKLNTYLGMNVEMWLSVRVNMLIQIADQVECLSVKACS